MGSSLLDYDKGSTAEEETSFERGATEEDAAEGETEVEKGFDYEAAADSSNYEFIETHSFSCYYCPKLYKMKEDNASTVRCFDGYGDEDNLITFKSFKRINDELSYDDNLHAELDSIIFSSENNQIIKELSSEDSRDERSYMVVEGKIGENHTVLYFITVDGSGVYYLEISCENPDSEEEEWLQLYIKQMYDGCSFLGAGEGNLTYDELME